MSSIKLVDVQNEMNADGWIVISEEYKNLTSEMIFECPHGHRVFSTWQKMRGHHKCPNCNTNILANIDTKVLPKPNGKKRFLALDQATKISGWAIYDGQELVKYGTFETSYDDAFMRNHQVKQWLTSMINLWRPDYVGLEDIQFQEESQGRRMGVTVFQALAQLQGVLIEVCVENNIVFKLCPTNTWRHVCGVKGKTRTDKKRSMQLLVKQWYDVQVNEDAADAIGIGHYIIGEMGKEIVTENWE